MSGRVLLGVGIAALVGAGIFGAGFWLARRVMPMAVGSEVGLRILPHGGWEGLDAPMGRMPFHVGPEGGLMPYGPEFGMGPHGPGERLESAPWGRMGRDFHQSVEPLTAAQAREAVETFLASLDQTGLQVGEVILFEEHAYVVVEKASTGTGAFEGIVDARSRAVYPAFGPAMMWNTEFGLEDLFGRMRGRGEMVGMTGPDGSGPDPSVLPGVTLDHASQIASAYIGERHSGTELGDGISFPGYYTFPYLADVKVAGMLSVNAYTGQVWDHNWHGLPVEISE